jgi:hypothetical protein
MAKKKKIISKPLAKHLGLTLEEAFNTLVENVTGDLRHQDYPRVTELAELYRQLITGDEAEELLEQFVRRENTEAFQQRVKLTTAITPAVAHRVMSQWFKVPRVEPIVNKLDYEGDQADERKQRLQDNMNVYNGKESVSDYLGRKFITLNGTDPNAFIFTVFDNFDNKVEMARPYPMVISCEEATNFEYKYNELLWLIRRVEIKYLKENRTVKGGKKKDSAPIECDGTCWTIYTYMDEIRFTQVDEDLFQNVAIGTEQEVIFNEEKILVYKVDEKQVFRVDYYEPKAGMVPGFRVGVLKDLETDDRTCVNLFHPALPYFMKTIKTVSELDLTMSLHAFLQKLTYVPRCPGAVGKSCHAGYLADGRTKCSICGGTGKLVISSAQDDLELPLPSDLEDMIDLTKITKYVDMPIDIVKFQDIYIDKLEEKVMRTLYGSDVYVAPSFVKTATESTINMESVYNALWPLATGYAEARKYTVQLVAAFTDLAKGLIQEYKFARDFKFKSRDVLLEELKQANEVGAEDFIVQEITSDISKVLYADRPDELRRLEVKRRFAPFKGKKTDAIQYLISNDLVPLYRQVLYAEFETIFQELEDEQMALDKNVWFYDMDYKKQAELLKAKVDIMVKVIEAQKVLSMPPGFDFNTPPAA